MPLRRRRRPAAAADLDEIWIAIAIDNLRAADRILHQMEAAENRLADFPELGRTREELAPSLRSWRVGDYLIYYRISGADLLIIRILHGARDIGGLLSDA